MDYLFTAWYVVLALLGFGFVIFIHELGHFLFAKWAGVRVDRFSIGFGPVLLTKKIGDTEYALSLLPLGGYVKMLGQEDTPTAVDAEARVDPRSFLAVSKGWQVLILLGGVLFNLISSLIILVILAWYGMPIIPPIVGNISAELPAANGTMQPSPAVKLGLREGDRIVAVNGTRTRSFEDAMVGVISAGIKPVTVTVCRNDNTLTLPENGAQVIPVYNAKSGLQSLGFEVAKGWRLIDIKRADGPLRLDDPQHYERVIAIDGKPLPPGTTGQQIEDRLAAFFGNPVSVTLAYRGKNRDVTIRYAGFLSPDPLTLGFPVRIAGVIPGSPAERAGLKPGDYVERVDGISIAGTSAFLARVRAAITANRPVSLDIRRGQESLSLLISGEDTRGRRLIGAMSDDALLGVLPYLPTLPDGQPGPLATAGLKIGDAVVAMRPHTGGGTELDVLSGGTASIITMPGLTDATPLKGQSEKILEALLGSRVTNTGDGHGFPGANQLQVKLADGHAKVLDLTPLPEALRSALLQGLKTDDHVTGLTPVARGADYSLDVVRGGTQRTVTIPSRDVGVALAFSPETEPYQLTSWTEAFGLANDAAVQMVDTTLRFIPRFFKSAEDGGINPNKALTGPIGIFNLLRKSVEVEGYAYFLKWIAIIGLNLFLINLLPIPITDGGQLAMMGIEAIIRRPLPDLARNILMWAGLLMVGALMLYVIGLDVSRLFGFL